MTRLLVLASEPRRIFAHLLSSLPELRQPRKVAYIWTAFKPEIADIQAAFDYNTNLFMSFGWQTNLVDLDGMTENGARQSLADRDLIFVEGGNTFFLLKAMRDSGFTRLIHDKLAEPGMVYIGCSAGSVVAGPSIESAGWPHADRNNVGLTDLTGLGFIDEIIHPHHRPETIADITPYMQRSRFKTRLLTDDQALIVRGDTIDLIENPPLAA